MSEQKTIDELLRFLHGVQKKYGTRVELVVKYRNNAGKLRKSTGWLVGVRNEAEVGLRSDAKNTETWHELSRVHDIWKRGSASG